MHKKIRKQYKFVKKTTLRLINIEARKILFVYNIQDKTEPFVPVRPRITLKDYKENFLTDPKVGLICPAKSVVSRCNQI